MYSLLPVMFNRFVGCSNRAEFGSLRCTCGAISGFPSIEGIGGATHWLARFPRKGFYRNIIVACSLNLSFFRSVLSVPMSHSMVYLWTRWRKGGKMSATLVGCAVLRLRTYKAPPTAHDHFYSVSAQLRRQHRILSLAILRRIP
jgi:hypothetical protein